MILQLKEKEWWIFYLSDVFREGRFLLDFKNFKLTLSPYETFLLSIVISDVTIGIEE
ncbi:hypothetical protein ACMZ5S_06835 [Streptococcus pluranimalium]